jgi:hypothetical protein
MALGFGATSMPWKSAYPGNHGYQADNPGHPRNGVYIDDADGVSFLSSDCLGLASDATWVFNNAGRAASAGPAGRCAAVVKDVVPGITNRASARWSVAQALTHGNAANPNTGPFCDSPAGLP